MINSVNNFLIVEVKFGRLFDVNDVNDISVLKTLLTIDGRGWKEIVLKLNKYSRHKLGMFF